MVFPPNVRRDKTAEIFLFTARDVDAVRFLIVPSALGRFYRSTEFNFSSITSEERNTTVEIGFYTHSLHKKSIKSDCTKKAGGIATIRAMPY